VDVAFDGYAKNQFFKGSISTMLKHVGTLVMTATQGILVQAAYYSIKDGSRSAGASVASTYAAAHENAVNYWKNKLRTCYDDALTNAIASAQGFISREKSQLGTLNGKDKYGNLGVSDAGTTLAKNLASALRQNYGNYLFASLITSNGYWSQNRGNIHYHKDVAHLIMDDDGLVLYMISIPALATPPTSSSMLGKIKDHGCKAASPWFWNWWHCASRFGPWKYGADIGCCTGPSCDSCDLQFQAVMGTNLYNQGNTINWHNFFIDTTGIANYTSTWSGYGGAAMPGNIVLIDFTNVNE